MEAITIFALSVVLFGAVHLIFTAVDRFGKGMYNTDNQKQKRADWFCFFKTSDLLGKDWVQTKEKSDRPASKIDAERLEQRRKQQLNRPRLYV
jgi:hypothetical protein